MKLTSLLHELFFLQRAQVLATSLCTITTEKQNRKKGDRFGVWGNCQRADNKELVNTEYNQATQ